MAEPTVQGYGPCHPWYYYLGGTPLPLSDIPPNPRDIGDLGFALGRTTKLPEEGLERLAILREKLVQLREELAEDEARYQEVVEKGWEALKGPVTKGKDEGDGCNDLHCALALTYSHVTVLRAMVLTVEQSIREAGESMLPGTTDGLLRSPAQIAPAAKTASQDICLHCEHAPAWRQWQPVQDDGTRGGECQKTGETLVWVPGCSSIHEFRTGIYKVSCLHFRADTTGGRTDWEHGGSPPDARQNGPTVGDLRTDFSSQAAKPKPPAAKPVQLTLF